MGLKIVRNKFDFDGIREVIKRNNSSEYGKESYPIVLFPSDVNNIASEILKMKREDDHVKLDSELL